MTYLVMETHPAYAVVLDEAGRFLKVANRGYQPGDRVTDVIPLRAARLTPLRFAPALTAAAGLAACLCLGYFGWYRPGYTAYGTLNIRINPEVELSCHEQFFLPENAGFLFDEQPDLILDAIDTVTAKLYLAEQCQQRGIPLVTCLGTGNRLDPSQLRWGDISETAGCGCPLARVMRRELKKRGVQRQTVVYSIEQPAKAICPGGEEKGRHSPASCAFVPPAAGSLLASVGYSLFIKRA